MFYYVNLACYNVLSGCKTEIYQNFNFYCRKRILGNASSGRENCFPQGDIKDDIHITLPEGFSIREKEDYILKLQKALYGPKLALRAWNSKLNKVLTHKGFVRSINDYVVYYETSIKEKLITESVCR